MFSHTAPPGNANVSSGLQCKCERDFSLAWSGLIDKNMPLRNRKHILYLILYLVHCASTVSVVTHPTL